LHPGDTIPGLLLRVAQRPGRNPYVNFRIAYANTTAADLSAGFVACTVVLGPVNYDFSAAAPGEWITIFFNTRLVIGPNNLVIELSRDDTTWTVGGGVYVKPMPTPRSRYAYMDSGFGFYPFSNTGFAYNEVMAV